jgi:hypothetical protein
MASATIFCGSSPTFGRLIEVLKIGRIKAENQNGIVLVQGTWSQEAIVKSTLRQVHSSIFELYCRADPISNDKLNPSLLKHCFLSFADLLCHRLLLPSHSEAEMYPTPYKMASHCQLQLQILIDN